MPIISNPIPLSMQSEISKTSKILASFIKPSEVFGPDKVIPPEILTRAKGLAILSVVKAGFIGTARFGSGVVVARLPDGSWSAPSAIVAAGGGFGGQIGFEFTDFVFILNNNAAVQTFSSLGSITFGGNVSIAAGPVGRNAEAAGAASLKSVSGIFAYSKTKGLFAGVSLEGSGLVERSDANRKFYGRKVSARELLSGQIPVPPQADALMRVLNARVFSGGTASMHGGNNMYNDVPVYDDNTDDVVWQGRKGSAYGEGVQRASTWQDDPYDRASNRFGAGGARANPNETFDRLEATRARSSTLGDQSDYVYSDRKGPAPGRPAAPKPNFGANKSSAGPGQAIAKFNFDADQPGDLGFRKGDIITIVKRTESETDWWTGRIGNREGIFPSNYVDVV